MTESSTRRRRSTRSRQAAAAAHADSNRKSFALELTRIPSFSRLNDEFLFEDLKELEDSSRRERRSTHSRRRRKSCEGRREKSKSSTSTSTSTTASSSRRRSLQIPETKVVIQPVGSSEDVLFRDDSSRSCHTDTTASSSSSTMDDIFQFEGDDDDFFGCKKKNLGSKMRLPQSPLDFDDDDDDLAVALSQVDAKSSSSKSRRSSHSAHSTPSETRATVSAHSRTTVNLNLDDQGPAPRKGSQSPKRRPRRSVVESDYKKLGDVPMSPSWSLKKLVSNARSQHRRHFQEVIEEEE